VSSGIEKHNLSSNLSKEDATEGHRNNQDPKQFKTAIEWITYR